MNFFFNRISLSVCLVLFPILAYSNDVQVETSPNHQIVVEAINSLSSGIRYRFGGTKPEEGLDCSAYIAHLFKQATNATLPRTAQQISRMGERVDRIDIQPGDLVFFGDDRHRVSHIGIYIGNKKFIHASRKHGTIYESSLTIPYWRDRFSGARRLDQRKSMTDFF